MNVLLLCNKPAPSRNARNLIDHIESFSKFSKYNITELNPFKYKIKNINLSQYGIIIIHYSLNISSEQYIQNSLRASISEFNGVKVLFIQDEYKHVNRTIDAIKSLEIDIIFTCLQESEFEKVYSRDKLGDISIFNTLTGYVPEKTNCFGSKSYHERNIDVSYRARDIPEWLGKLGKEKIDIADKFQKLSYEYNLTVDIDCTEQSRLYGKKWIELLENSKAALGTESGASVFDFTGEIQTNVERYKAKHPEATFETLSQLFFESEEGLIYQNQISPRCFEYAYHNVLMVLFEGEYSGILHPHKHYIPLKKDFSNINEVIQAIKNKDIWKSITTNAKHDLINSGKYSYRSFINKFTDNIESTNKFNKISKNNNTTAAVNNLDKNINNHYIYHSLKYYIYKLLSDTINPVVFKRFKEAYRKTIILLSLNKHGN